MDDPSKGRIKELDYMRAFAILGVVAIHAGSYSEAIVGPSVIPPVTNYIAHLADFAVPLFFAISGFLLASRPMGPGGVRAFYRRRLSAILIPYLFFSAVYLVYNRWVLGQSDLIQAGWSILLFDSVGVFWFLGVLLQLYLLFPFLSAWLDRLVARGKPWKLPVYAGILYVAWYGFLSALIGNGITALGLPVDDLGGRLTSILFPGNLVFFVLGMYIARAPAIGLRGVRDLESAPMAAVMLAVPAGMEYIDATPFLWYMSVVPYTIVASALVYKASAHLASSDGPMPSIMGTVGRYSFGIYMVHILALDIVANGLWAIGLDASDAMFYGLLYPLAIAICIAALFFLNLMPFGTLVSGVRTKDGKRQRLLWWRTEEDNALRPS